MLDGFELHGSAGQVLPQLIVEVSRNPPAFLFLGCHQALQELLTSSGQLLQSCCEFLILLLIDLNPMGHDIEGLA
jgi:hypothetical protein